MVVINTLDVLLTRIRTPNNTEDIHLNIFNMITRINETKASKRLISFDWKCKFDGRKCNSNQKWNKGKCQCECKNPTKHHICKKEYICNRSECACEIHRYLNSIVDDLVITCDDIIEYGTVSNTASINLDDKKAVFEINNHYFLLTFFFVAMLLLITVDCYHCIKH